MKTPIQTDPHQPVRAGDGLYVYISERTVLALLKASTMIALKIAAFLLLSKSYLLDVSPTRQVQTPSSVETTVER